MGMRMKAVVLTCAVLSLLATGCSSKKKPGPGDAGDLTDQKLADGSSLGAYEKGLKPPGGDSGPLRDINFAFDSYELDESARATLRNSADWLKDNGYNPEKVRGVEINNLKNFVGWSKKTQPSSAWLTM